MEDKGIRKDLKPSDIKNPKKFAKKTLREMKSKDLDYVLLVYNDKAIDVPKGASPDKLANVLKEQFGKVSIKDRITRQLKKLKI